MLWLGREPVGFLSELCGGGRCRRPMRGIWERKPLGEGVICSHKNVHRRARLGG